MSLPVFGVWLTSGWEGEPGEVWYVPGEALAWYRLNLPDLENTQRAFLIPVVHPAARRNGIGRRLVRHAADRAAANGRTVLGSVAVQDSALRNHVVTLFRQALIQSRVCCACRGPSVT